MKHSNTSLFSRIIWLATAVALAVVAFFAIGFTPITIEADEATVTWELTDVKVAQNNGCIFTKGQTAENLRYVVTVTATYTAQTSDESAVTPEPRVRVLEYKSTNDSKSYIAVSGETVELTLTESGSTGTLTVKVTAPTEEYEGEQYTGTKASEAMSITYSEDSAKTMIGITAAYRKNYNGTLTTGTQLGTDHFYVFKIYNNGAVSDMTDMIANGYTVGNLFPDTAFESEESLIAMAESGSTYGKDVVITYSNFTTTARVEDIKFVAPDSVGGLIGEKLFQTALSPMDISGISVVLKYGRATIYVPLSIFPMTTYSFEYFQDNTSLGSSMVAKANFCDITFTYPTAGKEDKYTITESFSIEVARVGINAPIFFPDTSFPDGDQLDFYDGVSLEIEIPDYSQFDSAHQPDISIKIQYEGKDDGSFKLDKTEENKEKETEGYKAQFIEGSAGSKDRYKITFLKPGIEYTIQLLLNSDGDFKWGSWQDRLSTIDEFTIKYTVQIAKSTLKLTGKDTITWEYGKSFPAVPDVKAKVLKNVAAGETYGDDIIFKFTTNLGAKDGQDDQGKLFGYYHLEYRENGSSAGFTDAVPTKAGKYEAHIITHDTNRWKSSTVYEPNNSFLIEVTVTPVKINPNNLLFASSVVYNRTVYTKSSILNSTETNKFVDDKGITRPVLPLNVTFNKDGGIEFIKYADTHTVDFALTDDNFIFSTDGTIPENYYTDTPKPNRNADNIKFTINQLEIISTVTATGWTYGDNVNVSRFSISLATEPANYVDPKDYVTVSGPEFYKKPSTPQAGTDLKTWGAGDYYVLYNLSCADDEKTSLIFNATEQKDFTVDKKILDVNDFNLSPKEQGYNHIYDHDNHTINISGYSFVNGDTGVISKTGTWKSYADGATAESFTDDVQDSDFNTSSTFVVKNAGTYVVTLLIANENYKFSEGKEIKLTYTVDKATANFDPDFKDVAFNDQAEDNKQEVPDFQGYLKNIKLNKTLTADLLEIEVLEATKDGQKISWPADITASGKYVFTFKIVGGSDQYNYDLAGDLKFTLTIAEAGIEKPTVGSGIEYDGKYIVFDGDYHDVIKFIKGWTDYYGEYKIQVSVKPEDGEIIGSRSIRNVGTYKIIVKPAANFRWSDHPEDENASIEYPFEIKPLQVELAWNEKTTYNGEGQTPTVTITNLKGEDFAEVVFDGNKIETDAGRYINAFTITGLTGANAGNYTIDGVEKESLTGSLTIYKELLSSPTWDKAAEGTYNGAKQTTDKLSGYQANNTDKFTVEVTGKYPAAWFNDDGNDIDFSDNTDSNHMSFNVTEGKLTFYNAGVYTVAFTLIDTKNYCLDKRGEEEFDSNSITAQYYTTSQTAATILSKVVDIPKFGDYRAMEWEKYSPGLSSILNGLGLNNFKPLYGLRSETPTSESQLGAQAQNAIGQYHVLLSFDGDDKYNYQWGKVTADNADGSYNGTSFIDGNNVASVPTYTREDGARMYLYYAITASQVSMTVTAKSYTFGDNGAGYYDEGGAYHTNDKRITKDNLLTFDGDGKNYNRANVEYTFTKNGQPFTVESESGLPWEAGEYSVSVKVTFENSSYQQWTATTSFTVSALNINVVWKYNDGADKQANQGDTVTLTYKGSVYEFTPVITKIPVQKEGDDHAQPKLITQSIDSGLTNVGEGLWIRVQSVEDNNYNVTPDSTKLNIKIEQATLYVKGVSVSDHIYGNELGYANKYEFTKNSAILGEDSTKIIAAHIVDGEGNVITGNLQAVVGGVYYVVPYIVEGEEGWRNYKLEVDDSEGRAVFTVKQRPITITIDESKAKSEYGSAGVNLNSADIYTVRDMPLPEGAVASNVFVLETEEEITPSTPVEKYQVRCTLLDKNNYTFNQDFGTYFYTVTKATLTVSDIKETYNGTYNAQNHNMSIIPATVSAKNDMIVKWKYKDGNAWKELGELELINARSEVSYTLKAIADNHEDSQEFTITVTINRAVLTVTMEFSIYYGEVTEWSNQFTYKATVKDLRNKGESIYTVTGFYGDDETLFYNGTLLSDEATFRYAYKDASYERGHAAGRVYELTLVSGLESTNYTFSGEGTLTVVKLPVSLTVAPMEEYPAYGEELIEPTITVSTSAPSLRGGTISLEKLADEDTNPLEKAYSYKLVNKNDLSVSENKYAGDNYYLVISSTDNYTFEDIKIDYIIEHAENGFGGDGYHQFFEGDGTTSNQLNEETPYAWVYGDYSAEHTDGYDPTKLANRHYINDISMTDEENALTVTVERDGQPLFDTVTASVANIATKLREAFNAAWEGQKLVVGTYHVHYHMDQTTNYKQFDYDEYFKVKRATLTVTPVCAKVVYGEEANYVIDFTGFVKNGGHRETLSVAVGSDDNVEIVSDASRWNITGYAPGEFVGKYTLNITDKNGQNASYFANYEFAYGSSEIEVTARTLVVSIKNAINSYMFVGEYDKEKEDYIEEELAKTEAKLTIGNGAYDYYPGDGVPFDIKTSAVFEENGYNKTLDAKTYTIYLVFKDGINKDNYIIKFSKDCNNKTTEADFNTENQLGKEIIGHGGEDNNAGTYTITRAKINIDFDGPFYQSGNTEGSAAGNWTVTYNGCEWFFKPVAHFGERLKTLGVETTGIEFAANYYKVVGNDETWLGEGNRPIHVGNYRARFTSTGKNSNFENIEDAEKILIINRAIIELETTNNSTTYNGDGQDFTITFKNDVLQKETLSGKLVASVEFAEHEANKDENRDINIVPTIEGSQVKITATEAGKYTVKLTLDNSGDYAFGSGNTDDIFMREREFTINRWQIKVFVDDVNVEYGAPIGYSYKSGQADDDHFGGFKVQYGYAGSNSPVDDATLNAAITKNKSDDWLYFGFSAEGYSTYAEKGEKFDIIVTVMKAVNFEVVGIVPSPNNSAKLTVVPRKISLNVSNSALAGIASTVYNYGQTGTWTHKDAGKWGSSHEALLNERFVTNLASIVSLCSSKADTFGSGKYQAVGDLSIQLIIGLPSGYSEVKNVGEYPISIRNNENFDITYIYNDKPYGEGNSETYKITKSDLHVKVHKSSTDKYNDDEVITVTYGYEITSSDYKVLYSGWLNNEGVSLFNGNDCTVTFTTDGEISYTPYESHVNDKYNAHVKYAEELTNYNLIYEVTELKITPRTIVVSDSVLDKEKNLKSKPYTEADDGYHDGVYGAEVKPDIDFDRLYNNEKYKDAALSERNYPKYGVSYSTANEWYKENDVNTQYQVKGAAPRRAGTYEVTIKLTSADFVFENGKDNGKTVVYSFTVTKKAITIFWEPSSIKNEDIKNGNVEYVGLAAYRAQLMKVYSFMFGQAEVATTDQNLIIDKTDSVHNTGLKYKLSSAEQGVYRMIIELLDSAKDNYCWADFDTQAIVDFAVSGNRYTKIQNVQIEGWTYGEKANDPTAEFLNNVDEIITSVGVSFEYARVISNESEFPRDNFTNLSNYTNYLSSFTSGAPVNAGVYIVRAYFNGNETYDRADPVYQIFIIGKKTLTEIDTHPTSKYSEDGQGNVNISTRIALYDSSAYRVVSTDLGVGWNIESDETGIYLVLTADRIRESGYSIMLRLSNVDNYNYPNISDDSIFITWVVEDSEDNEVEFTESGNLDYCTYGETFEFSVRSHFRANNIIEYHFIAKDNAVDLGEGKYAAKENFNWEPGLPVNAGEYIIRVTSRTNSGGYNDAFAYHEFKINKATLTAKAEGSAVYGQLSGNADVTGYSGFTLTDPDNELKNGDTQTALREVIANSITYEITNAPESGLWGAGTYFIKLTAITDNYEIVCEIGEFIVNKATLSVVIDNSAWSYYSRSYDYSGANITVSGLITSDSDKENDFIARIRKCLYVSDNKLLDNGSYPLTVVEFSDDNYVLDVTSGVYTIRKLPVMVVMDDGGYYYGETPVLPSVVAVYDGQTRIEDFDKSLITVLYRDLTEVPTNAGSYPYSITIDANCNYELSTSVSGLFIISKVTLDAELIEFEEVYYDGTVKAPKVIGVKNDAFDVDEFDVSYEGAWINANVTYYIVLTLKNTDNTGWKSVEGAERRIPRSIHRGTNSLVENADGEPTISITGWTYGMYSAEINSPSAKTKFGSDQITFEYARSANSENWFRIIGDQPAGDYWVRAVVLGTTDYETFYSEPVKFTIDRVKITAPVLNLITSGENRNDTYTASELGCDLLGVDLDLMSVSYEGSMWLTGNNVTLRATAAGTYVVRISIKNSNYTWADGVKTDENGNALIEWTVKKKQIVIPTHNDATFIINGSLLEYLPIGFDGLLMTITGNRAAYGGTFTAIVSLKDTDNYEWADGTIGEITFTWEVVGANTVFIVVISILLGLCGALAIVACVLFARYRLRAKANAATAAAAAGGKQSAEAAGKSNAASENNTASEAKAANDTEDK